VDASVVVAMIAAFSTVLGVVVAVYFQSRRQEQDRQRSYQELRAHIEDDSDERRFLLLAQYHSTSLSQSKTSFWW
jgi:hypothetical protein